MKYKHIASAIHNFGHSFTSLTNYVDGDYVIDELARIHAEGLDIEIDWLSGRFVPEHLSTPRIKESIGYWRENLNKLLQSHNVDPNAVVELKFRWRAGQRKQMLAIDDRGKEHKIYVNESK